MTGRYGGNIKGRRNKQAHPWQVSYRVLQEIGRLARPDLEAIGRKTRRLTKPPTPPSQGQPTKP